MKINILYILIHIGLAFTKVQAQDNQSSISFVEMIYWETVSPAGSGLVSKAQKTLFAQAEKSIVKVDYVIPPLAMNADLPTKEQRENVINEDGQNINKITIAPLDVPKMPIRPKEAYEVYKDFTQRRFFSPNKLTLAMGGGKAHNYIVEDQSINFGWQITEERKNIGGYECIKAVSQPFRGRVYEAWFAPAIPVSDGPWKLSGLPGLILEAKDDKNEIFFVFERVVVNGKRKEISNVHLPTGIEVISWEVFKKKSQEETEKVLKYSAAIGGKNTKYELNFEREKTQ
jgi:GLPGLI family protein